MLTCQQLHKLPLHSLCLLHQVGVGIAPAEHRRAFMAGWAAKQPDGMKAIQHTPGEESAHCINLEGFPLPQLKGKRKQGLTHLY